MICHNVQRQHFLDNLLMESLVSWTIYLERMTNTNRNRYMQTSRTWQRRVQTLQSMKLSSQNVLGWKHHHALLAFLLKSHNYTF